jgi:hypothetical protein
LLDDFFIGQRLQTEMEDHFERLWTLFQCRDGSMIEVADEGHLPAALSTLPYVYLQMKQDRPAWFTKDLEAFYLHNFRNVERYMVRFVSPQGVEHRSGQDGDYFGRLESYIFRQPLDKGNYGVFPLRPGDPGWLNSLIGNEPEVRAIIDTVYGRGRVRSDLPQKGQSYYDRICGFFPGGYQGLPRTVSDYMPYSGIHTLRRGWAPDDAFIEMLCQPPGGSANDRFMDTLGENWWGSDFWDTQFRYWDFGEPLLLCRPLQVDGQNQCQSFETRGWKPGSKTERLVEAPEKPLPNRFHCSTRFDYQECFFTGTYQNWELKSPSSALRLTPDEKLRITGPAIEGVHTTRQIFQLREERLFVVVDRIRFSDEAPHQISMSALMLPQDKRATVEVDETSSILRLRKPSGAQVTIRHFGIPGLRYEMLKPIGDRKHLRATWTARGESVLVTLLDPGSHAAGDSSLVEVTPLPGPHETGFTAVTRAGVRIGFQVPLILPQEQTAPVTTEKALLTVNSGTTWVGLAIGTANVSIDGRNTLLGESDCEFTMTGAGKPSVTPIFRPIDPPTVLPSQSAFVQKLAISIESRTQGVEIRYTTDGSEPSFNSALYTGPFEISKSCMVQARAFRPGVTTIPFNADGTLVSDISFARFTQRPPKRAVPLTIKSNPGLTYQYMEGSWLRLFGSADRLPAVASGTTDRLLDVSMRKTDGPFAVRYEGYIEMPTAGIYTFYAPREYVHNGCEPGYDLRVFVDGEEWRPGQMWHGLGMWSTALEKGLHRFQVVYADARAKDIENQRFDYWCAYPAPWVVWRGLAPELYISGPGIERRTIPSTWLSH